MYPIPNSNESKPPYPGFNTMPTPGDPNITSALPYPSSGGYPLSNNPTSYPPSNYPPSNYPPSNPPSNYPPSNYPPPNYPPSNYPPPNYPPSNYPSSNSLNYPSTNSVLPNNTNFNQNLNASTYSSKSPYPNQQNFSGDNPYATNPSLQMFANSYRNPAPIQTNISSGQISQPMQYNQNSRDFAPTVRDFPNFDARQDAEALRKAMKGFGTDEKSIINVLTKRSNRQRQQILLQYKMLYGKDLIGDLKSELSGKFESVIVALMTPTHEYDASLLRNAIRGLGTDEDLLIEILSSRNPADIRQIRQIYQQCFKRDLEKDIINDTSGHFRRLLVSLATGMRDEGSNVDPGMAHRDAEALLKAGVKKLGTDESVFNSILASRNFNQLRATMEDYRRISGHTLEQAIRAEMSGDLLNGMLSVAKCAQYKPTYFAEKLYLSMKGAGTNDDMLIRIVVTRCEVDMQHIKSEFQRMFGKTLESFISGDCSGDYKRVLIALVQGNV